MSRFVSTIRLALVLGLLAAMPAVGQDSSSSSEESTVPPELQGLVGDFILEQEDESLPKCPITFTDQQSIGGWQVVLPEACPAPYPPAESLMSWNVNADDGWTLTTADFKSRPASLRSINDAGVTLAFPAQDGTTVIPWDKFLQLDRGGSIAQPKGSWTLHLLTGDRLGGEPVSLANDTLTWRSTAAGELAIPLKEVRAFVRGQDPLPSAAAAATEDAVLLSNKPVADIIGVMIEAFDAS